MAHDHTEPDPSLAGLQAYHAESARRTRRESEPNFVQIRLRELLAQAKDSQAAKPLESAESATEAPREADVRSELAPGNRAVYADICPHIVGSENEEGIERSNRSARGILAWEAVLLPYDVFNRSLRAVAQTLWVDIYTQVHSERPYDVSVFGAGQAVRQSSVWTDFFTIYFVRSVRFVDGEVWTAHEPAVASSVNALLETAGIRPPQPS